MKGSKIPQNSEKKPVKAYNMAVLDDDSAEINMYGDVYMEAPRDFLTGERVNGQYIAADEFLEDLENIKDKSNITVHINSGGGDLYAGLAIYNRLKSLKGHVTTVNDAMAASAASLIFQAGDTRKMNKASNLMAHGVGGFLFGFYNLEDLKTMVTQFKAHNKAIVNVYAERMGVEYSEAEGFVKGETWLTGQEAIDKGLADEIIEEQEEEEETDNLFNSFMKKVSAIYKPQNSAIPAAAPQDADKKMEVKRMKTVEELRANYPDLVAQIEKTAAENARQEERERIQSIEEISNAVADERLITNAKYGDAPMTAQDLAMAIVKNQAKIGSAMLDDLKNDTEQSGSANVKASPKNAEEDDPEKEDEDEKKKEEEANNFMKNYNAKFAKGGRR